MSKYTTEVRNIVETYAGYDERADYPDVDSCIDIAIPKIFDVDNIPVYVPEHKPLLFHKILLHYYQREIGFETAGLWKLKLNTKLKEIMPYYNQLYASELLEYDPLQNVNNWHEHQGVYEDTSKVDNKKKYDNTTDTANTEVTEHTKKYDNVTNTDDSKVANKQLGSSTTDNDIVNEQYEGTETTLLKNQKTTERGSDTFEHDGKRGRDSWVLYSDTPQGGIGGLQGEPLGGGNVGLMLAQNLEKVNVKIKIIECDYKRCVELTENLKTTLVINGDGANFELLEEERVGESDVVVCVTNNDEKNLLCSLLAKQLGVSKVITRVSKNANARLFEKVGIDVAISENGAAIDDIENHLIKTDIEILATVERGQGEVLEISVPFDFKTESLMNLKLPCKAIIAIIQRRNRVIIPRGTTQIMPYDNLIVFTTKENSETIKNYFKR